MSLREPMVAAVVAGLLTLGAAAWAHPLAPSSLRLRVGDEGEVVEAFWRTPTVRPVGGELTPRLPSTCRPIEATRRSMTADRAAFETRWVVDCGPDGLVGRALTIDGLSTASTSVVVEVTFADGAVARGLLHRGDDRFVIPAAQGRAAVVGDYLRLGVEHLLSGADHILFVVGLLLLLRRRRSLIQAITAFTLGHSVSLALAALGVVRVPQAPVEVAIAVTLVVLALDVWRSDRGLRPGPVARWPWAVCAGFGLLHGLGFAGALAHTGLPEQAIPLSLFSFNVGIELGQLTLVVVAEGLWLGAKRLVRGQATALRWVPAYGIGSLAAYWVLSRSLTALGLI